MAKKTWVLDTETKGTGANMVPLEKVLRKPEPAPAPRRPAPAAEPRKRAERRARRRPAPRPGREVVHAPPCRSRAQASHRGDRQGPGRRCKGGHSHGPLAQGSAQVPPNRAAGVGLTPLTYRCGATTVLWNAAMRCSSPSRTRTTLARAPSRPRTARPARRARSDVDEDHAIGELARLHHLVADRAAGVDRVEDRLMAGGDRFAPSATRRGC